VRKGIPYGIYWAIVLELCHVCPCDAHQSPVAIVISFLSSNVPHRIQLLTFLCSEIFSFDQQALPDPAP
jgi:hypothetical protein